MRILIMTRWGTIRQFAIPQFMVFAVVFLFAAPLAAQAQSAPRVAFVSGTSGPTALTSVFRTELQRLGYAEGSSLTLDFYWLLGQEHSYAQLLRDLEAQSVDVIVVTNPEAALAARRVTKRSAVVFTLVGDPVGIGLVTSLGHPGGNITGFTIDAGAGIDEKRVQLLKEATPRMSRLIAWTWPKTPNVKSVFDQMRSAAERLGLQFSAIDVAKADDIDKAFAKTVDSRSDAVIVVASPVTFVERTRILRWAQANKMPAMYSFRTFVEEGGLMYFGPDMAALYRRAAAYVDKILKGTKPADLPVEQPTKFELVINLKTAKAIGLTMPRSILVRADQVIE